MAAALLQVKDVSLQFGGVQALTNVSFNVEPGEIFSIIGPNGAGKTTLFDCISGRYVPTGSIRMNGHELVGKKAHVRPGLGIMRTFQNIALFPGESVIDNILVGSDHRQKAGVLRTSLFWGKLGCQDQESRDRRAALATMGSLGLAEYKDLPAAELPYGIQKRVELARALMAHPRLILLDEPSMGLSPLLVREVFRVIKEIQQAHELTFLLVEQNVKLALQVADYGYVVERGCIRLSGSAQQMAQDQRLQEFYLGIGDNGQAACVPAEPE